MNKSQATAQIIMPLLKMNCQDIVCLESWEQNKVFSSILKDANTMYERQGLECGMHFYEVDVKCIGRAEILCNPAESNQIQ